MGLSLESRILNETVTRAEVLGGKWIKTPPTGINEFQESLPARVTAVTVKGKTIHIHFDNGWRIWNTLGMSGGWKDSRTKHAHFVFTTQGGRDVWFDDVRRFGNLIFIQHESDFNKRLKAVGPDLLAAETEFKDFERAISKRSTPICKALMDQKVIAGVGNYIKAEALYRARISPHSLCRDIPTSKLEELYNQLRWIMSKSLQQGGATFSTYSDMDGGEGSFPFHFHVYMKSTCPLGYPVVRELTEDGRTTHWVPQVQIN